MTRDEWAPAVTSFAAAAAATDGRAASTVQGYVQHVEWLARDCAVGPWEVTPTVLAGWLDGQSWSAHTRRKVLVSLRAFYVHGMGEGWCARSPLAGLPAVPPRRRGPTRAEPGEPWREPVAAFLQWLSAGARRDGTINQRRSWLIRLSETFADPWAVTGEDLALWLSREDWAPHTKRLGRSSVTLFYRWAEDGGRIARSPARSLAAVRIPRALPRPASTDAVQQALQVADDRVRLALLVAVYAGLRRAEIAGLHSRDVHDGYLRVAGKGGHERLVPLHPDLRSALRTELRGRREGRPGTGWGRVVPSADGWLFPSDDRDQPLTPAHLGKLIAATLPPGVTTHSLRHRFATQAYGAGRDLRAVQVLLGHQKPETTAIYAAVPDGALVAAVAGVGLSPG